MLRVISILLILCCKALHSPAQPGNLIFKHLTRSSGLPVDEVTCLAQDSTGFIWIGSKEGLFRFDGFTYKGFYHTPGNNKSIPGNFITKILVDKEGLLWIGTVGGVVLMKNSGQVLKIFSSETEILFTKESNRVQDILEEKDKIWFSTGGGLYSFQKKEGQITALEKHDFIKNFKYSTNALGPLVNDKKGKIWISTFHGVVIYNPEKKELFHHGNNPLSLEILNEKSAFRSLWLDHKNNTIIYSTWQPAVRTYYINDNKIKTIYSPDGQDPDYENLINQFLKDNHGTLWMATGKGIKAIYNENSEKNIVHQPANSYSILSDDITSLLQDKEGSIWVGTTEGISIAQPYRQSFINLSTNNADEYPFAKSTVNSIIPVDANTYLVGTGDGVYRTDAKFKVQKHYFFDSYNYDLIWKFHRYNNSIYISTQKGNLLYDVQTKKIRKLTEPPFDRYFPFSSFAFGKGGSMWMSQYRDNILEYYPENKQFKMFNLPGMGEEPAVLRLTKDRENNLWISSSSSGLLKFNEDIVKVTERINISTKNGLLEANIILIDLGEELLIGYVTKGISLYNKKIKTFRHYSKSDGLISNSVTDALQTDKYTVWITTRNGLSRFDLRTRLFINYDYNNGILHNDFVCITQLPDGRLAAGHKNGIVHFDPSQLKEDQSLSPPTLISLNVYGRELSVDSFSTDYPLHITHDENYFSFEFISLQYANSQLVEYEYMLDGFDKTWIAAGNRRFASYSNVTGGNYRFRARARLHGGEWVENRVALPVVIDTAFYKQVWFYITCALLILLIAYSIFRYRVNQLLRLEKIRAAISSDLHDEVGATLSSISIFSEMAKQSVPANSKAEPFLQRIGDRSRDSIEKMSDIIWSINPENDTMDQLLIRMKTFVNETVEGKDIAIHWEENEIVSKLKLDMSQRKNLYLLFKEAIINAVKYADAQNILVEISAHNKTISLKIKDDGKGFCMESAKFGNGIKNIKQRANFLGGKAGITSAPGEGTTVHVAFQV